MGNSHSANVSGNGVENSGEQLFVALKLHKPDGQPMPLDAVPHVTGSMPIVGLWDPAKAVSVLLTSIMVSVIVYCEQFFLSLWIGIVNENAD